MLQQYKQWQKPQRLPPAKIDWDWFDKMIQDAQDKEINIDDMDERNRLEIPAL
jgi:hypothetical protein